jgi:hypothetical protein
MTPDWSNTPQEEWDTYFNLILDSIDIVIKEEYDSLAIPFDDPKDFVNGFTLAGAFFSGLHLEPDFEKKKQQISSFRISLAMHLINIINKLKVGRTISTNLKKRHLNLEYVKTNIDCSNCASNKTFGTITMAVFKWIKI